MKDFERNKARVTAEYEALINRKNIVSDSYNGIYDRYVYPVLTKVIFCSSRERQPC